MLINGHAISHTVKSAYLMSLPSPIFSIERSQSIVSANGKRTAIPLLSVCVSI